MYFLKIQNFTRKNNSFLIKKKLKEKNNTMNNIIIK